MLHALPADHLLNERGNRKLEEGCTATIDSVCKGGESTARTSLQPGSLVGAKKAHCFAEKHYALP